MTALTTCLKKLGSALTEEDREMLSQVKKEYLGDRKSEKEATLLALDDVLGLVQAERSDLVERIRTAGGWVDDLPKVETKEVSETRRMVAKEEPPSKVEDNSESESTDKKIEDFGEVLHGARKHYWQDYVEKMDKAAELDVSVEPLSKSWPEPNYQKLIDEGIDSEVAAYVHSMRDEVPNKPRSNWKLQGWVGQVESLREFSNSLLSGDVTKESFLEKLKDKKHQDLSKKIGGRAGLYQEVGHEKSLKGITFQHRHYSLYRGEENVTKWTVEKRAKATGWSNWPKELAVGDSREEALENFKAVYGSLGKKKREVSFGIYTDRKTGEIYIGKKIGKNIARLKEFQDTKSAREYRADNHEELIKLLDDYKRIPTERRTENDARVGVDHRDGADVTPEQFAETFGFRGVQFGNYVENSKRHRDLNEAYDALMDLANIIDVPPKALSLNGELGLAFGARGRGGKQAPSAHYEPDTVVINLTKRGGAGSLAHEWFHGLDNYFSRMRGERGNYLTESAYPKGEGVRPEMVEAFKGIMDAVGSTELKARSKELDDRRSKPYWSTNLEMAARSFENYIISKLRDQNQSNDYLANIVSDEAFDLEGGYPYLLENEMPEVRAAFDHFFQVVETKETDQGVAMFSLGTVVDSLGDVDGLAADEGFWKAVPGSVGASVMSAAEVEASASKIAKKIGLTSGGVELQVRGRESDLPVDLQTLIRERGSEGDVWGAFYKGAVWLVADKMRNQVHIEETLLHEAYGHLGSRRLFGANLRSRLRDLYKAIGGEKGVRSLAEEHGIDLSGYYKAVKGMAAHDKGFVLMDELLAHIAQKNAWETLPEKVMRAVKEFFGALRAWLRDKGIMDLSEYGDTDLLYLLRRMREAVQTREDQLAESNTALMVTDKNEEQAAGGQVPGLFDKPDVKVTRIDGRKFRRVAQAKNFAKKMDRSSIENADTGWKIQLSRQHLDKWFSHSSTNPSIMPQHLDVVRGIRPLLENAVLAESRPAKKNNHTYRQVHRFYAPVELEGELYRVKLTVLEHQQKDQGRKLKNYELAEIETPAGTWVKLEDQSNTLDSRRSEGKPSSISIAELMSGAIRDDGQAFEKDLDGAFSLGAKEDREASKWTEVGSVDGMPAYRASEFNLIPDSEIDQGLWALDDPNQIPDEVPNGFSENGLMGHGIKVIPGSRSILYKITKGSRVIGELAVDVKDGDIVLIHDIVIRNQSKGDGEAVVRAIAANTKDDILIADITPDSEDFWVKMGIGYINHENDAQLNWEGYHRSRIRKSGSDARAGDVESAERGSEGLHQEGQRKPRTEKEVDDWIAGFLKDSEDDGALSLGTLAGYNKHSADSPRNVPITPSFIRKIKSTISAESWGVLTHRQIVEVLGEQVPVLKDRYLGLFKQYETDHNLLLEAGGIIVQERRKLGRGKHAWSKVNTKISEQLSQLQHEATIAGVDPSEKFTPLVEDVEAAQKRIKQLKTVMRDSPGSNKTKWMDEVAEIKADIALDKKREDAYPDLLDKWNALPSEAQAVYIKERDHHKKMSQNVQEALLDRIEETEGAAGFKKAMMAKVELEFQKNTRMGPYFPLARFGKFWVSSASNGEQYFDMFESKADQQQFIQEQGNDVEIKGYGKQLKNLQSVEGVNPKFVTEVDSMLQELGDSGQIQELRDSVYQAYLESLPEVSARKHYIHRKKRQGFYEDQMRAFADKAQHDAKHIARLRHMHRMNAVLADAEAGLDAANSRAHRAQLTDQSHALQALVGNDLTLTQINKQLREINSANPDRKVTTKASSVEEAEEAIQVQIDRNERILQESEHIKDRVFVSNGLSELRLSQEALANPNTHWIAQNMNSLGFAWYLGMTPAAAMVNLTQTPAVALPIIGAKFGMANASKHMLQASKDFIAGKGSIEGRLNADELKAFKHWHDSGLLETTNAHDLAGVADAGINTGSAKFKLMGAMSYMFHHAERMNREITALAAYRAAKAKGKTSSEAMELASSLTWKSHFDYSAGNRARFMRGNFARVITQFKQYSQNITYLYAKTVRDVFAGASPEEKAEARRAIFGMLLAQFSVAGTLGLPAAGLIMGSAQILEDVFGDEDDPEEVKAEYRQWWADTFIGNTGGRIISKGFIDTFTPFSVSGRLSLSDLWIRTSDRDLEGRDLSHEYTKALLGPTYAIADSMFVAADLMTDGHPYRAIEYATPKFIKDSLRSLRYLKEDAKTMSGNTLKEVELGEAVGQFLGFSSSELSELYETNNAINNTTKKRNKRRKELISAMTEALQGGSGSDRVEARKSINEWNRKHPTDRITQKTIRQSMRSKRRYSESLDHGVRRTKRNDDLLKRYDYSN